MIPVLKCSVSVNTLSVHNYCEPMKSLCISHFLSIFNKALPNHTNGLTIGFVACLNDERVPPATNNVAKYKSDQGTRRTSFSPPFSSLGQ